MSIRQNSFYVHDYNPFRLKKPAFTAAKKIKPSESFVFDSHTKMLIDDYVKLYDFKQKKTVQWAIKRTIDYVGASVALIAASPIMLATAALIKLESKGPAIFKQKRIGKAGKEFVILKFRSMRNGAPEGDIDLNIKRDPRVTKMGNFVRKFSIDELPQLINVLKGDMSLIGPRPMLSKYYDDLHNTGIRSYKRFAVLPGGRLDYKTKKVDNSEECIAIEENYVTNWNLLKDIKIGFKIIKRMITGKNI